MIDLGYKVIISVGGCLLYHFIDVHWFARFIYIKYFVKKEEFNPKTIKDTLVIKRRVGLRDLDAFFHMNNARYLWHLDASRAKFFFTSGLNAEVLKLNKAGYVVAASSTIRYRRSLQYFEKYKIVSRIAYVDEKNVYMEHKFISEKDEFISAVAYLKLAFVRVKPIDVLKVYFKVPEEELQLECPKHLKSWIEFQEFSSQSLKQNVN